METLKDWAEYYKKLKVWTFPNPLQGAGNDFDWLIWKNMNAKQYQEKFNSYSWERYTDNILFMVGGKVGLRVLHIKDKRCKNSYYKKYILRKILEQLGLPEDYRWIIDGNSLDIIIDTPNTISGGIKGETSHYKFLWETFVILPTSSSKFHFIEALPDKHPAQIRNEKVQRVLLELDKERFWDFIEEKPKEEYHPTPVKSQSDFVEEWRKTIKNPESKKVAGGCLYLTLLTLIGSFSTTSIVEENIGVRAITWIAFFAVLILGLILLGAFSNDK